MVEAKNSQEYQQAQELIRREFTDKKNEHDLIKATEYAEQHYIEYAGYDTELTELINVIVANKQEFDHETLKNAPAELIDKILDFFLRSLY